SHPSSSGATHRRSHPERHVHQAEGTVGEVMMANVETQEIIPPPRRRGPAGPAPAPLSDSAALLSAIEKAALNPQVDIGKVEQLLALYERIEGRRAETAFNEALTAAQAAMRPVATDMENSQTRSRYASYAALDRVLRPIYTNAGFSLTFNTAPGAPEAHVRVTCTVAHRAGHVRTYTLDLPADGKGAKGGDIMSRTHATASALSYGMRYLLRLIFNIAVGEGDDGCAKRRAKRAKGQRGSLMALSEPTALFAAEMRKAMEGMARTRELIHSVMDEHAQVIVQLGEDSLRMMVALGTLAQTGAQLRAEVSEVRKVAMPICAEALRQAGRIASPPSSRPRRRPCQDQRYATSWPPRTPRNWEAKP